MLENRLCRCWTIDSIDALAGGRKSAVEGKPEMVWGRDRNKRYQLIRLDVDMWIIIQLFFIGLYIIWHQLQHVYEPSHHVEQLSYRWERQRRHSCDARAVGRGVGVDWYIEYCDLVCFRVDIDIKWQRLQRRSFIALMSLLFTLCLCVSDYLLTPHIFCNDVFDSATITHTTIMCIRVESNPCPLAVVLML